MQAKIAYLILGALAAMTSALPQERTTTTDVSPDPIVATDRPVVIGIAPEGLYNEPDDSGSDVGAFSDNAQVEIAVLTVCKDSGFRGRCENLASQTGRCYNLYNGWNNVITSAGPNRPYQCKMWDETGCQGADLGPFGYPGYANVGESFNDRASSYKCTR